MASFVPSVERAELPRKGAQHGETNIRPGEGNSSRWSSPSYKFGSRGATTLQVERKRWTWAWALRDPPLNAPWRFNDSPRTIAGPRASAHALHVPIKNQQRVSQAPTGHGGPDSPDSEPTSPTNASSRVGISETAVVVAFPWRRRLPPVLLLPCGAHGSHLGAIPLWTASPSTSQNIFQLDAFSTPILQIASSPFPSTHRLDGGATSLIVRAAECTYLMSLSPNPAFSLPSNIASHSLDRIAEIDSSMTEGRRLVDVALDPLSYGRAVIADEGGGVWLWWEEKSPVEGRLVKTTKLCKLRAAVSTTEDSFYRVAFGVRPNTVLIMSRTTVELLDAEPTTTPNRSITLLSLPVSSEVLTALDRNAALRDGPFTYVCTSKQVLWVDPSANRSRSPALRWQHDLGSGLDVDLGLSVIATPDLDVVHGDTILVYQMSSGRVHGIVTSNHAPASLVSEPWSLNLIHQEGGVNVIACVASDKQHKSSTAITVVGVADSVIKVGTLARPANVAQSDLDNLPLLRPTMDPNGDSLERLPSVSLNTSNTPMNTVAKAQVLHARWAWLGVNEDVNRPLFRLEEFERRLTEEDPGLISTVTTRAEIVRDVTYDDPPETRSHILRAINYSPATSVNDLQSTQLGRHYPFTAANGSGLDTRPVESHSNVHGRLDRNRASVDTQQQRSHLGLHNDLLLSSQVVYSKDPAPQAVPAHPVASQDPTTVDELFAQAAGQLSLDDRTPILSFGILPRPRSSTDVEAPDYTEQYSGATVTAADVSAAHGLLLDWELGTNPRLHEWKSARSEALPSTAAPRRERPNTAIPPSSAVPRDPVHTSIVRSRSRPVSPLPRLYPHSSPMRAPVAASSTESLPLYSPVVAQSPPSPSVLSDKDTFVQTQVERGAHGARPEVAVKAIKKKATKRRHGGF